MTGEKKTNTPQFTKSSDHSPLQLQQVMKKINYLNTQHFIAA